MQNLNFSGNFSNNQAKVSVTVGLFQFEEGGNTMIYSPAFDLTGYGKDILEAKQSFEETLDEFLDYTIKKKTFVKELNRLGWKLKQSDIKKKKIKSPELASLISKNDYLAEILNEKDFTKFDQTVSVPAF
ncbi:MAG: hypothetical protein JST69_13925 [Bacteroidetes bacterium]|nr:hypothetical protein [Bacteroidota bacterium]